MKKSLLFIALISCSLFCSSGLFARSVWVDNKNICEQTKGNWRLFNNDCGDGCANQFSLKICSFFSTYSCDFGENKCWDGDKCLSNKIAQKFWDKIADENKTKRDKELEEWKVKRSEQLAQNSAQNLTNNQNTNQIPNNNTNNQQPNFNQVPQVNNGSQIAGSIIPQNASNNSQTNPNTDLPTQTIKVISPEQELVNKEKKEVCEQKNGTWMEFKNGCVDNCSNKIARMSMCTEALTFGCKCGENKCWNNAQNSCITIEDYKKSINQQPVNNPPQMPNPPESLNNSNSNKIN